MTQLNPNDITRFEKKVDDLTIQIHSLVEAWDTARGVAARAVLPIISPLMPTNLARYGFVIPISGTIVP